MKNKLIRVVLYISQDDYRKLKSILALSGLSVSKWFRDKVRSVVSKNEQ